MLPAVPSSPVLPKYCCSLSPATGWPDYHPGYVHAGQVGIAAALRGVGELKVRLATDAQTFATCAIGRPAAIVQ